MIWNPVINLWNKNGYHAGKESKKLKMV